MSSNATKRKRRPTARWITDAVAYWETRVDECDLGSDWAEAHERCWRCGYKRKLQRCHIVPFSLGGSETSDNIVALCSQCHAEAPDVCDQNEMWDWIKRTRVSLYDTYWTRRALSDVPVESFHGANIELAKRILRSLLSDHACRHLDPRYGSRFSDSTVAWCIRRAIESSRAVAA